MGPAIASDSPANARSPIALTNVRNGLGADAIAAALIENLHCLQGKLPQHATRNDWYMALAYTVRDRMMERYVATVGSIAGANTNAKAVAYLSAEFLTGPHLGNGLINLGIWQAVEEALSRVGQDLSGLLEQEEEPGLGNGGLGRLAACYMDSLATLNVPAIGYGIRYEFGIFDQAIRDGWQVEVTDKWLRFGNPWEIVQSEIAFDVKFGGRTEPYHDEAGRYRVRWLPEKVVKGIAYDTPVPGYRVPTTNLLRLWKAEATEPFDFEAFNVGDYYRAVDEKVISETISKVLYPNDEPEAGKQLRLAQQYFFVSCSLQDMIRLLLTRGKPLNELHLYWAAQLNDTIPLSPSPSCCDSSSTSTRWSGVRPGPSRSRPAPTRTTRYSPKRWSDGRCRCLPSCCLAIWRLSTRSIAASWTVSGCAIRMTISCFGGFR